MDKVLVITNDDALFEKVSSGLVKKKFNIERSPHYREALEKLRAAEYKHVVCNVALTDKDSFNFIGQVKELPYNHPNLLLSIAAFLYDQEQAAIFEQFIDNSEVRKEINKIFECDFSKIKHKENFEETASYLELSEKNNLPFEKTFLFDFSEEAFFLGVRGPVPPKNFDDQLTLIVCLKSVKEEISFKGKFMETTKFDEDKEQVAYLTFVIAEESRANWEKYLDLFESEALELEELINNARGY